METSTFVLPYEPLISVNCQFPSSFVAVKARLELIGNYPTSFVSATPPTTCLTRLQQIQTSTLTHTHIGTSSEGGLSNEPFHLFSHDIICLTGPTCKRINEICKTLPLNIFDEKDC